MIARGQPSIPTAPAAAALAARARPLAGLALAASAAGAIAALPPRGVVGALLALGAAGGVAAALRRPAVGLALAAVAVPFGRLAAPGLPPVVAPLALVLAGTGALLGAADRARARRATWPGPRRSGRAWPPNATPMRPSAPAAGAGAVASAPLAAPVAARSATAERALIAALGAYLGAHAAAAWGAPDLGAAAAETARWVEAALAGVLAATLATRRDRAVVVLALLLGGAAACGAGAWLALRGFGPEAFAVVGRGFSRAHWPFGQPNPLGGYANLVWPLGAALAVVGLERRGARGLAVAGAVAAAAAVAGLGLSWSRGAWLAAAAGGALMVAAWAVRGVAARDPGRWAAIWAAATAAGALALAGAFAAPEAVAARLASIAGDAPSGATTILGLPDVRDAEVTDASFATVERLAHWQAAAAMWAERPWLGQGPGHYESAYPRFRLGRWSDPLGHAHNTYLHTLAETGLLGLATYAALLALVLAIGLRSALAPRGPLEEALGLALAGALGATAVHGLFDNLWVHEMPIHVGLLVGLTLAARRHP